MEPQTADLYVILLLDNNDSFSKCNKKIVTDYKFNTASVPGGLSSGLTDRPNSIKKTAVLRSGLIFSQ